MTVLRRGYVPVEPDVSGFDDKLREKFAKLDPGGKAGKQLGGQLNRALKRLDLDAIDIKGDPKKALAAIGTTEARLLALSRNASTVEIKVRAEQALKEIGRFRKTLGDVAEDEGPEAASGFAAKFSAKLGPLLASMPIAGPMGTALAGAAVAAAPLIGAAVAGGIIGGAGIGGVVGGLSLAAKDTRVKAAADELGDRMERRLYRAGGAFVGPAIAGLGQVQRAFDDIDLEGIFADSAKFVQPLAAGVSAAVVDIGGALRELIANADGPVQAIADGIALIGRSAADGMRLLADNGEAGADALRTVFGLISLGVQSTLLLVNALTELYEINKRIGGDILLQQILKLTGSTLDANTFSARRTAGATLDLGAAQIQAEKSAEQLKEEQDQLKNVQTALTAAQDGLSRSLDTLGGKNTLATRNADALRTAMDNLYGATQRQADANQSYEASWDALSASVKANKRSLDVHTEAGRSNRDTLKALITSTNEAYIADINAGVAIDKARQKHENRIKAIKEESKRLGLNEDATKDLIGTYGKIPGKKQTDLILGKVGTIVKQLENLYIVQRAIAEGIPLASARAAVKEKGGPAKQFGGYREGGRTANVAEDEVAGVVHGKEVVFSAPTVRRIDRQVPGFIDEVLATGQMPGYRQGGRVAPVDTSRRIKFPTDVSKAYVMPLDLAKSKVTPQFGDWPSSPASQRGDSGVWRRVLQLIKSGPDQGSFGNAYRPGDPKWHGSGRAVDWMGFNMDALAGFLAARRPLELIHRTRKRDYAYTRGQNKGSFNESLMNAHRNHIHIAMANGGVIGEPVMGTGLRSGNSYSFGERGPETVTPGVGTGGNTLIININGPVASKKAAEDLILEAYNSLVAKRKIKT